VEGHQLYCPGEPVRLALTDLAGRFEVEVTDNCAPGARSPAGQAGSGAAADSKGGLPAGIGIAVIEGLADDVQISETATGTSIRMSWPSAGPAR
jgi:anti-sigma regulatory factor (Ser/Thr protein kinase)